MKELFIKDIEAGEKITGYFALRKWILLEKDGRFRIAAELGDSTGRINAILWDADKDMAESFQPGDIVKIRGPITVYQEALQLRIDRIRLAEDSEFDLGDFFRKATRSKEELSALLEAMIDKIDNAYLQKLLQAVFETEGIKERYVTSPAAKLLHHDTIGGLADHSLNMAEIVIRLADQYPALDRDLLICGALLHDIGKIWEYEVSGSIDFTTPGRLVGHINQGDEFITSIADSIELFPEDLLTHVRHLIISHQGEKEKGSPVLPQTPEAVFLHAVDELDSRMGAVDKIRERTGGRGWSSYQKIFERFFYFGDDGNTEDDT